MRRVLEPEELPPRAREPFVGVGEGRRRFPPLLPRELFLAVERRFLVTDRRSFFPRPPPPLSERELRFGDERRFLLPDLPRAAFLAKDRRSFPFPVPLLLLERELFLVDRRRFFPPPLPPLVAFRLRLFVLLSLGFLARSPIGKK